MKLDEYKSITTAGQSETDINRKYRFSIKTVSETNQREHWRLKHKRRIDQQTAFMVLWRTYKPKVVLPATVIFTRYSCHKMDSDNLAGSFKYVRDQLAKEIKIDDGSDLIRFEYRQERIDKRDHYFDVEIKEI